MERRSRPGAGGGGAEDSSSSTILPLTLINSNVVSGMGAKKGGFNRASSVGARRRGTTLTRGGNAASSFGMMFRKLIVFAMVSLLVVGSVKQWVVTKQDTHTLKSSHQNLIPSNNAAMSKAPLKADSKNLHARLDQVKTKKKRVPKQQQQEQEQTQKAGTGGENKDAILKQPNREQQLDTDTAHQEIQKSSRRDVLEK
jgi:hypothetical protein